LVCVVAVRLVTVSVSSLGLLVFVFIVSAVKSVACVLSVRVSVARGLLMENVMLNGFRLRCNRCYFNGANRYGAKSCMHVGVAGHVSCYYHNEGCAALNVPRGKCTCGLTRYVHFQSHGRDRNKHHKEDENMSEEKKHWTEYVEEFAKLQIGENHFDVTGEPDVTTGKYGDRLSLPTSLGPWRISLNSPIARELKKIEEEHGKLEGLKLTVVKTGEGKDTRYSIKQASMPKQTPALPANQPALNLSPEEIQAIEEMRKTKK
jgi:hypothetical protein